MTSRASTMPELQVGKPDVLPVGENVRQILPCLAERHPAFSSRPLTRPRVRPAAGCRSNGG